MKELDSFGKHLLPLVCVFICNMYAKLQYPAILQAQGEKPCTKQCEKKNEPRPFWYHRTTKVVLDCLPPYLLGEKSKTLSY